MTEKITRGTENVLADLGFENAEELSTKVRLAISIRNIIVHRGLKQREAARILRIPQSNVSNLMNYKLDNFSVERLMGLLTLLGRDIEIRVRKAPRSRKEGRISVAA
jgi:predicted XRE-type DNA-binding protein